MQITVTGHRMDVTQAIHDFTISKFNRLERHFSQISSIDVIFDIENLEQVAEANVQIPGAQKIHVKSQACDLYSAIDNLVSTLDRKIIQLKEKRLSYRESRNHHHRSDDLTQE